MDSGARLDVNWAEAWGEKPCSQGIPGEITGGDAAGTAVCCPASCGVCTNADGKAACIARGEVCCPPYYGSTGRVCTSAEDVACVMPTSDQNLLEDDGPSSVDDDHARGKRKLAGQHVVTNLCLGLSSTTFIGARSARSASSGRVGTRGGADVDPARA